MLEMFKGLLSAAKRQPIADETAWRFPLILRRRIMHFRRLALLACALLLLDIQDASAQRKGVVQRVPSPYQSEQLRTVSQWTNSVISELEHLQGDLAQNLRRNEAHELYHQTDQVLSSAMHFQRTVQDGRDRDHIYRDFQSFDQQLHQLFDTLENSRTPGVAQHLSRIHYADDQLHRAISAGDTSDDRRAEVIARQAHALDREAKLLDELASRLHDGRNERLHNAIHDFAGKAAHFHETVESDQDRRHAKLDFSELQQSWSNVVRILNSSDQSAYLYRQARRVEESYNELAQRLTRRGNRDRDHAHAHEHEHERNREGTVDLNGLKFRFRID